ncbi:hypothetical protein KAR91_66955 [Candidatus Pacearchaeota archaeon]|nr:hypothetical protein [Candidatus Pacearchaeota archaeon]
MSATNGVVSQLLALQQAEFPTQEGQVDLDKMSRRIECCRAKLPAQVLSRFYRRTDRFGKSSIVQLDKGVCTGCSVMPGVAVIHQAKSGQVISCPHCGRLLWSKPGRRITRPAFTESLT